MNDAPEPRLIFGQAADLYNERRPGYPADLVQAILDATTTRAGDSVVEVGAGTGKASVLFAKAGVNLTCIEPDKHMAALLQRNLEAFPNTSTVVSEFEQWTPSENDHFSLLVSAQAWHWIQAPRVERAVVALKPRGHIALLWNVHHWGDFPLREELDALYRRFAPSLPELPGWGYGTVVEAAIESTRQELESSDLVGDVTTISSEHSSTVTPAEYTELLRTYSNHRTLDPTELEALLDAIRNTLEGLDQITMDYTTHALITQAAP